LPVLQCVLSTLAVLCCRVCLHPADVRLPMLGARRPADCQRGCPANCTSWMPFVVLSAARTGQIGTKWRRVHCRRRSNRTRTDSLSIAIDERIAKCWVHFPARGCSLLASLLEPNSALGGRNRITSESLGESRLPESTAGATWPASVAGHGIPAPKQPPTQPHH
jgi:hypothetical protein